MGWQEYVDPEGQDSSKKFKPGQRHIVAAAEVTGFEFVPCAAPINRTVVELYYSKPLLS